MEIAHILPLIQTLKAALVSAEINTKVEIDSLKETLLNQNYDLEARFKKLEDENIELRSTYLAFLHALTSHDLVSEGNFAQLAHRFAKIENKPDGIENGSYID